MRSPGPPEVCTGTWHGYARTRFGAACIAGALLTSSTVEAFPIKVLAAWESEKLRLQMAVAQLPRESDGSSPSSVPRGWRSDQAAAVKTTPDDLTLLDEAKSSVLRDEACNASQAEDLEYRDSSEPVAAQVRECVSAGQSANCIAATWAMQAERLGVRANLDVTVPTEEGRNPVRLINMFAEGPYPEIRKLLVGLLASSPSALMVSTKLRRQVPAGSNVIAEFRFVVPACVR